MTTEGNWFKSSYSAEDNSCIEFRELPGGGAQIRDSKNPEAPVLTFTQAEVTAFVLGAEDGEFHRLIKE